MLKIFRALFAMCLLLIGVYWLVISMYDGYHNGFAILSYGDKAKDALSGVWFALVFMAYGVWELYRLIAEFKRRKNQE